MASRTSNNAVPTIQREISCACQVNDIIFHDEFAGVVIGAPDAWPRSCGSGVTRGSVERGGEAGSCEFENEGVVANELVVETFVSATDSSPVDAVAVKTGMTATL